MPADHLSLALQQNVDLKAFNTLSLPVLADYYFKAQTVADVKAAAAFAKEKNLPIYILGGGSNTVFNQRYQGLVLHVDLKGIAVVSDTENEVVLEVAAGESWDQFLQYCLAHDYYGLENMAIIPGTVGAAPIQNIGAYGKEVARYITAVNVIDLQTGTEQVLPADQCAFAYRDSIFKQQPDRYFVSSVLFRVAKTFTADLSYQALADAFKSQSVTAQNLRDAVIALRTSRLPDPAVLPNAGSFFKNPVVSREQFIQLKESYPTLPSYPQEDGSVKLPAAWLIEQAGWRGKRLLDVGMYDKQALVLVNYAKGDYQQVRALADQVISDVLTKFAVELEPEPIFVGS